MGEDNQEQIADIAASTEIVQKPPDFRETSAREIAHAIVITFRYALWGTLLGGFVTIAVGAWRCDIDFAIN